MCVCVESGFYARVCVCGLCARMCVCVKSASNTMRSRVSSATNKLYFFLAVVIFAVRRARRSARVRRMLFKCKRPTTALRSLKRKFELSMEQNGGA